ncbi:hypothetical protein P5673_018524 [Acropora cervicornis]|uniref:Uncharacterized protein n=1 Tax=Acropora cervicornis TaxID=6130 RepID=A0AAD9QCR5_ACRCE|nr:hypothetical protein P5673_018524 [Acropora cervicornis]
MDEEKLLLPRLIVTAHADASARKLRTHLTVQPQHSVPDDNTPLQTPLGLEESRFPVVLSEEIKEINELAGSKNTKQTTQTWLTVRVKWCEARNIDNKTERFSPQALDKVLTKF